MKKNKIAIKGMSKENKGEIPIKKKWDNYLDDYKNYLEEYRIQYELSLEGSLISLSKYPYMKERALVIYERLIKAKNRLLLNKKQINNIFKIKMKFIESCHIKK
jgi:hypothetical protein